jgi:two-component system sensor histidine kinase KdpD
MAHGNVYQLDRIDAALSNYFRPGNLTALRELALLWLADAVEDNLQRYREEHGIARKWETRERVVVALTGGPEGEALLRRAARIAARVGGGDLLAVHVARSDGLAGSSVAELDRQRALVESLGGSYHSVVGDNIPAAVLDFARASNATQIVIGASRRNPIIAALTGPGTGMTITRLSGPIDVHVVSHDYMGRGRVLPKVSSGLTRKRRFAGLLTAAVLLSALVPICAAPRGDLGFGSDLLLFLLAVIIVSLIGGFITAFVTAIAASLLLNYYFVPPIHKLTISEPENIFALNVFVVVALLVAKVVDVAARHSSEAARSNAEAETISTLAGSLLRGEQAIPAMLERVRESFGAQDAALLRRESGAPASSSGRSAGMRGTWSCVASVGDNPCLRPEDADTEVPVGEDMILVLRGRLLAAEDQRVLTAFATQVAIAYEQRRLTEVAEAAVPLVEADRVRTALLNAVSHDLRTPLASAKAAVSSLRSPDVAWSEQDQQEFLANADDALDRLTALVTNLLDLSRLQVGVLAVETAPVAVEDVVSHALDHAARDAKVEVDIPAELPAIAADPGLLERAVANLVENALRYSPSGDIVRIAASAHRDTIQIRVIDHGPGIPAADRAAVFAPFQRRDDHTTADGQGVGLGLAIARGFVEAMHGTITLDDTPGGGLIAAIELPIARP